MYYFRVQCLEFDINHKTKKKLSCSDLPLKELGYCVNSDSYQEVEISCIFVFLKVFRKGQGK